MALSDEAKLEIDQYLTRRIYWGALVVVAVNIGVLISIYDSVVGRVTESAIQSTQRQLNNSSEQIKTLSNHAAIGIADSLVDVGKATAEVKAVMAEVTETKRELRGLDNLDVLEVQKVIDLLKKSDEEVLELLAIRAQRAELESRISSLQEDIEGLDELAQTVESQHKQDLLQLTSELRIRVEDLNDGFVQRIEDTTGGLETRLVTELDKRARQTQDELEEFQELVLSEFLHLKEDRRLELSFGEKIEFIVARSHWKFFDLELEVVDIDRGSMVYKHAGDEVGLNLGDSIEIDGAEWTYRLELLASVDNDGGGFDVAIVRVNRLRAE